MTQSLLPLGSLAMVATLTLPGDLSTILPLLNKVDDDDDVVSS